MAKLSKSRNLIPLLVLIVLECFEHGADAKETCKVNLINPISLITFLADCTYNFLDFAKEAPLCPVVPAELPEWNSHTDLKDWPGVILFTPDTHEDFEIYFDRDQGSFLDEDIEKFVKRGFNPDLPTLIYLHAFTQNPRNKWLRTVRKDYIQFQNNGQPKINLLFFDYQVFARSGYPGTARWVPALGKVLAMFMDKLVKLTNLDPMKLHLISFSLGNHISGMAGRQSENTIGRITALDPAGWCFSERYDHQYTKYGLRSTDAFLVDVNHFDIDFLGTRVPIGDLDIYMNGGMAQPGCATGYEAMAKSALSMLGLLKKSLGEGHSRAAIHSVYTVDEKCHQIAYGCTSYEAFLAGECGQCGPNNDECFSTSIYGVQEVWSNWREPKLYSPRPFKKMFLKTAAKPPFCVQHYQIVVKLKGHGLPKVSKNGEATELMVNQLFASEFKHVQPKLVLFEENQREWFSTSPGQIEHEARPSVFTSLILNEDRNKIYATHKAKWILRKKPTQISIEYLLTRAIESVEINYMSHIDYDIRKKFSVKLCPDIENEDAGWMKKC